MSKNRIRNIILKVVSVFVLIIFITWLILPAYIKNALIYKYPGIEDWEIFDYRVVKASPAPAPWPEAKDYNKIKLTQTLSDTLERYKSVAFVIIQNDSLLFEKYWEGYGRDSYSSSFSMAKSIVSLLIGAAIDEGKIGSIDDPVYKYLPFFNEGKNRELKIRDLLTMSSGSNWKKDYNKKLTGFPNRSYYGDDLPGLARELKIINDPGKKFVYRSGDTELLGLIVSNATGKNLSEYAEEKLWQPLGAEHDALWSLDRKNGTEKAFCCFNSNALDFARFGKLILNKGKIGDRQLVSEDYITAATKPASYLLDRNNNPVDFYGYQFWIMNYNGHSYPYMRGFLGQYVIVVPEKNALIVRLGHERSQSFSGYHPWDAVTYLQEGLKVLE
ncbi:MAG: serine hydrolase [Chlorobi bacterium]|nr:serine hydrolase [Chlorobiota bacterium]